MGLVYKLSNDKEGIVHSHCRQKWMPKLTTPQIHVQLNCKTIFLNTKSWKICTNPHCEIYLFVILDIYWFGSKNNPSRPFNFDDAMNSVSSKTLSFLQDTRDAIQHENSSITLQYIVVSGKEFLNNFFLHLKYFLTLF